MPEALARKRPSAIAFHQGHKPRGILELPVLMATLLGAKQMLRVVRKNYIKALKSTRLCFGNGQGDTAHAVILLRLALGLIDLFLIIFTVLWGLYHL